MLFNSLSTVLWLIQSLALNESPMITSNAAPAIHCPLLKTTVGWAINTHTLTVTDDDILDDEYIVEFIKVKQ